MADIVSLTDLELLSLLKDDEAAAFTEIYNRHWKFLFTAANNALRHRADCMDVCQAVFMWLWENRKQVEVKTNLRGYLYTAVKYKIANLIRQGKVRETLLDNVLTADIRAEEHLDLEVKELKNFIAQLIQELPERCREVFLLSRDERLSHRQISERLGISEKTVDDHITRALKKLRIPLGRLANIFMIF
ncbi:RNA polymerase sigma-70 factor [Mucilaginibacter ximonensis]|uniref:RNA polymerase sigma-70 factor n=1 Tax=Mucilaginibacter ximonensis TaxID=538021 RepID=A0ABW5Y8X3_9SPHI